MSSCPYEERGEPCQCYGINEHKTPTAVMAEESPGAVRVIASGPFKGRRYVKTAAGWQRVREVSR